MTIRFAPCTKPLFALPTSDVEHSMDAGMQAVGALRRQFAARVQAGVAEPGRPVEADSKLVTDTGGLGATAGSRSSHLPQ